MTPCEPTTPSHQCDRCQRFYSGPPLPDPEERRNVVIDASVIRRQINDCPMFRRSQIGGKHGWRHHLDAALAANG